MLQRVVSSSLLYSKISIFSRMSSSGGSNSSFFFKIHGLDIPVIAANDSIDISRCLTAKPFLDWASSIDKEISIEKIEIQSVDYFGSRVGFLKFNAHATFNNRKIPSIVFMRGGAVSILVLLRCIDSGQVFVVCCRQPRVPVGKSSLLELPAGMLDDSGSFVGVAAKELEEETGIKIEAADLVDLTAKAMGLGKDMDTSKEGQTFPGVYPSAGGSDEFLRLLLFRKDLPRAEIDAMRGKATGNIAENECIVLELVKYEDLWRVCSDMKALSSITLYERLRDAGEI